MLADSYLYQLNPFAIQLTESIGLRWYGLAYIAGFVTGWLILRWMGQKKISPLRPEQAGDLLFTIILGVLIGGRIGYGLFYDQAMFYTFTSSAPWWEALAIHHGGMSSHGGIVGVLVVVLYWGRKHNIPRLHLLDVCSFCAAPGLFFGRLANFVNAELWGKALPIDMQSSPPWWSVKYPVEITENWIINPTLYAYELSAIEPLRSSIVGGSFYPNLVAQAQAGNQTVVETIRPLLTAWYPSQLFQAVTDGPILFIAIVLVWWKPRKPGVVASWFLVVYGISRIVTEVFRQPDVGVNTILGLSRGQFLSVFMIIFGLTLALLCARRSVEKLGGFQKGIRSQVAS